MRQALIVSIHAPAWGATLTSVDAFEPILFQSTHPHGVRHPMFLNKWASICFNPRTRMGCDTSHSSISRNAAMFQSTHPHGVRPEVITQATQQIVSIHAPAWGATNCFTFLFFYINCFNPRTRMGCDVIWPYTFTLITTSFNPRTRMGCDQ